MKAKIVKSWTQERNLVLDGASVSIRRKPEAIKIKPTSVVLYPDEVAKLDAEVKRRHSSKSDVLRLALRELIHRQSVSGISDEPSHCNCKNLEKISNLLMSLAYATANLDRHITRRKREHVRLLLSQAIAEIQSLSALKKC